MENTITFTYNPYKYFQSYKNVLTNIRKHYPHEDIFVFFDKGRADLTRYIDVAKSYDCIVEVRDNPLDYVHRTDPREINEPKITEWYNRLIKTCELSTSKWIMLVEDDVLLKRKIKNWPSTDCGTNRDRIGFLGGGSIFQRERFLECIKTVDINKIIEKEKRAVWAGDVLLKHIFLGNDSTHEKWVELAEPGYFDGNDHAVFHGYKDLHNIND